MTWLTIRLVILRSRFQWISLIEPRPAPAVTPQCIAGMAFSLSLTITNQPFNSWGWLTVPVVIIAGWNQDATAEDIFGFHGSGSLCKRPAESPIQQAIELRPNRVFLCVGYVAISTFLSWLQRGSRRFRLVMIEIVEAPAACGGIALGVLDSHVSAVEVAREITAPRRFSPRSIRD